VGPFLKMNGPCRPCPDPGKLALAYLLDEIASCRRCRLERRLALDAEHEGSRPARSWTAGLEGDDHGLLVRAVTEATLEAVPKPPKTAP